jgi:abortive infection bacteriophage resistance protein
MVCALHQSERSVLAVQYGISQVVLSSVTHHFAFVRNLCAHHCRLLDRVWLIKADLSKHSNWQDANAISNKRVFVTLLLM